MLLTSYLLYTLKIKKEAICNVVLLVVIILHLLVPCRFYMKVPAFSFDFEHYEYIMSGSGLRYILMALSETVNLVVVCGI